MGSCAIRAQVAIGLPNAMVVVVKFGAETGPELCQHSTGPAGEKGFSWVNFRGGASKNPIDTIALDCFTDDVGVD